MIKINKKKLCGSLSYYLFEYIEETKNKQLIESAKKELRYTTKDSFIIGTELCLHFIINKYKIIEWLNKNVVQVIKDEVNKNAYLFFEELCRKMLASDSHYVKAPYSICIQNFVQFLINNNKVNDELKNSILKDINEDMGKCAHLTYGKLSFTTCLFILETKEEFIKSFKHNVLIINWEDFCTEIRECIKIDMENIYGTSQDNITGKKIEHNIAILY